MYYHMYINTYIYIYIYIYSIYIHMIMEGMIHIIHTQLKA